MIETRNLTIRAGTFCLRDVNILIPSGAYGVVMGKTGSGKTTLLEAICGLKNVISGRILFEGRDITDQKPAGRGIGFVPQDGALFETMTVRRHLAFAVQLRRWPKAEIDRRVDQLAKMLEIDHLFDRKPPGLSGGERVRFRGPFLSRGTSRLRSSPGPGSSLVRPAPSWFLARFGRSEPLVIRSPFPPWTLKRVGG